MAKFATDKAECVPFGISWLKIAETRTLIRPTITKSTVTESNMFKINKCICLKSAGQGLNKMCGQHYGHDDIEVNANKQIKTTTYNLSKHRI